MRTKEGCKKMVNGNRLEWAKTLKAGLRGRFTSVQAAAVWAVEISAARFRLRALLRRGDISLIEPDDRWAHKVFIFVR